MMENTEITNKIKGFVTSESQLIDMINLGNDLIIVEYSNYDDDNKYNKPDKDDMKFLIEFNGKDFQYSFTEGVWLFQDNNNYIVFNNCRIVSLGRFGGNKLIITIK